jgi:membrane peptidoglycan carboxypeptidase
LGIFAYLYLFKDLPSPKILIAHNPAVTTKMYDRHGELLYKIYKNENRSIISLSDIPSSVIKSTLAIEDAAFYDHPGFSLKGIARAFSRNTTTGSVQGGSTITQQLVKNTLLTNEKTLQRKLREVILAVLVENYFTKDEILSMYLNQVGFGGTAYGVEEAAQQYFSKSIKDVNLAEAALIAGLPAAPSAYSPFGAYPEAAVSRQHEVLRRLVEEGYLSSEQAEVVKTTPLHFASPRTDIKAPHFVMYAKDILADRYGEALVNSGGLEVTTTLDLDIQELAQVAITEELTRLKQLNVTNAAVLVTNPQTGEILAMVGSQNYFDVSMTAKSTSPSAPASLALPSKSSPIRWP